MAVSGSDYNDTWWRHAVFYQIYPRSFMDSNNDGIGDLQGVIAKLPHLADLGITATWLSPIFESPMIDFGYDISNFTAIQPEYGDMKDFDELIAKARELGIKVILDFVPNHTSDQCEWFRKSAAHVPGFEDFYVWADGKRDENGVLVPPNNWPSVFYGSAWTWHEQRQQFFLHQFTAEQPDLNYRCPAVVAAMDAVLHFWLDRGVSGFRVDALSHLFEVADLRDEPLANHGGMDPKSYDYTDHIFTKDLPESYEMLQHWQHLMLAYSRQHGGHQRILMTECMTDLKAVMDYYEDEHGRLGAQFSFNFLLIDDLKATQRSSDDASNRIVDARDIVSCIQKWLTYMPRGHVPNWVLGNHDRSRVATRLGRQLVDVMHMLLLMLPGVAVTYNGEEIGMEDNEGITWAETVDPAALNVGPEKFRLYSRDPARTPFQWSAEKNAGFSEGEATWLPMHPNYENVNLAQQKLSSRSHYQVYKQLVKLRQMATLQRGRCQIEALNRHVVAIKRSLKENPTVLVILNVSATEQNIPNLNNIFGDEIISEHIEVLVASGNSMHQLRAALPLAELKLAPHEGLVGLLH